MFWETVSLNSGHSVPTDFQCHPCLGSTDKQFWFRYAVTCVTKMCILLCMRLSTSLHVCMQNDVHSKQLAVVCICGSADKNMATQHESAGSADWRILSAAARLTGWAIRAQELIDIFAKLSNRLSQIQIAWTLLCSRTQKESMMVGWLNVHFLVATGIAIILQHTHDPWDCFAATHDRSNPGLPGVGTKLCLYLMCTCCALLLIPFITDLIAPNECMCACAKRLVSKGLGNLESQHGCVA